MFLIVFVSQGRNFTNYHKIPLLEGVGGSKHHRRPKLGMLLIYNTLHESLARFRKLLENGPKYKNKDELPNCRCVLMHSGCIRGVF